MFAFDADLIKSYEDGFETLAKLEPELAAHLQAVREAAPESARFLAQRLFGDSMVEGVGNKLAYQDFLSRAHQGGVHVMLDGNDFGQINKHFGQSAGDDAIKAMGAAISRASRANRGKLWRVGGDEFRAWFQHPDHAHQFVRQMRSELEGLPHVGGVHRHSVSVGLAPDPDSAEQALIHAKNAKKAARYVPGQAETHVHSLLPGAVGPVKVRPEPDIPPTIRKPVLPGQTPMPLPTASVPAPTMAPAPMTKSEGDYRLVYDSPARPVPVFFLGNDEGLSPDGAAFLKFQDLTKSYDLDAMRAAGFTPRWVAARRVRLSVSGLVLFERA